MDEQLIDLLLERGLTEEQIDQIAALSGLGTEEDILGRQQLQAQSLLQRGMPDARTYGNIYRHAHPTEFLGTLGSRVLGAYRDKQLNERQRGLSEQRVTGRQALLRALLGGGGSRGNLTPPPQMPTSLTQPMAQPPTFGYSPRSLRY